MSASTTPRRRSCGVLLAVGQWAGSQRDRSCSLGGAAPWPSTCSASSASSAAVSTQQPAERRLPSGARRASHTLEHACRKDDRGPDARPRPVLGALAAVAAAMLMAGYVVAGKAFVSDTGTSDGTEAPASSDPGVFLLCRQLVATAVMLACAVHQHGVVLPKREHRPTLHTLGFLNFVNAIGFVWGIKLTTAFVSSVTQLSIPVMAIVLAAATGEEIPTLGSVAGLLTTVVGCGFVAFGGEKGGGGAASGPAGAAPAGAAGDSSSAFNAAWAGGVLQSWAFEAGVCILLVQCFSFVTLVVVQKKVLKHYSVSLVVAWSYTLCTLWSLVAVALAGNLHLIPQQLNSSRKLALIAYSALGGAVAYFFLIGYASKHLKATFVAASVALEPLAVSAMGMLFFGLTLNTTEIAGYALAAFGTVIFAFAPKK